MPIDSPNSPVTKLVELNLEGLSRESKTRAKEEAGRIIVEEIQTYLDSSNSPVSGGQFKKKKEGGNNSILLEFGNLRNSIEFKKRSGNTIEVGVFKSSQTGKAFGHNTDFEGHPSLDNKGNRRQFIPDDNENFKRKITSRVKAAIDSIREFDESREELREESITVGDLLEAGGLIRDIGAVSTAEAVGTGITLAALFPEGGLFDES